MVERLRDGPLPVDEAVRITLEVAARLEALHNLGNVYRDIKPFNILFDGAGRAKVADLGLAQLLDDFSGRPSLGSAGEKHPGTPGYASPEQEATVAPLTPSSNVCALGCVLFETLTDEHCRWVNPNTLSSVGH